MYPSEVEMHYARPRHPKGGVSPLRCDIAVYDHLTRQKNRVGHTGAGKWQSRFGQALKDIVRFISGWRLPERGTLVKH